MSPTIRLSASACLAFLLLTVQAFAADGPLVVLRRVPEGGLQPQVAADGAGAVHLVYFKGDPQAGDGQYARSADGGASWSKAMRANSTPGAVIAMGSIRGMHLAMGKRGRPHIAWMGSGKAQPRGPGDAPPMLYARLNDGGTAFEAERCVLTFATGLDGGGSVAADEAGHVYVAWHGAGSEPGEQFRRVYLARSTDEGKTFAKESAVDEGGRGACGCCGMRAWAGGGGACLLYRTAHDKVNRDMAVLYSGDTGKTFKPGMPPTIGAWKVAQCPMSSASLVSSPPGDVLAASGKSASVLAAWESAGRVSFATITDGRCAAPISAPPPRKDAGHQAAQKHPVAAVDKAGRTLLAWTEGMGWNRGGAVAWQVYTAEGEPIAGQAGFEFGVPAWSLVAAFARPEGGFVVMY